MAIPKLHHVGIVMNDLKRAEEFLAIFGLEEDYREYVEPYQAICIFSKSLNGTSVEMVVPDGGVLYNFNEGRGGIHHIAFSVDNVEETRKEFEERGLGMLESEAVKGAGPILVNFLRPRYGKGILVEFVETIQN